jgi:CheY-like chemotaxis protein/HPt (histidine-containing phosphotransfer) domain-containing protein
MARILIIEDNPANMKLACLLMGNVGHSVVCAVDAESGLTLARAEQPDLILMDIQLPGMDGFAATALLKQDRATAAIPVIALTSMAMKEDQQKSQAAGCDAYIAKPLRYQELYAAIDALLANGVPQAGSQTNPFHDMPIAAGRAIEKAQPPLAGQHETAFQSPSRDDARRNDRLILVAEDNETNQKLILRQLALLGFSADVASNGSQALQRWQSGSYALVLSDLHMPGMDGYELTAAIRALEQDSRRIPIVAMTASYVKGDADHCRTADVDDYLSKPLQLADLKATLEKWLPAAASSPHIHHESVPRVAASGSVDVSVLENLVGNDPAVILEFLHDFLLSAAKIAPDLIAACKDHAALQASEQAHKLMSSARSIGALALGELCAEMETAGKAGSTETLATLLPMFERELDAVKTFLHSLQGQHADRPCRPSDQIAGTMNDRP